jgi:tRNA(Ile)-lysidine synthase
MPTRHRIVSAVAAALERVGVSGGSTVMVALSGGADSVALLHVLLELQPYRCFNVAAAHLNHRIRGVEADRDEAFVCELCERLGVALICERAEGLTASTRNLEERARELRFAFFECAAETAGADFVALAHHRDDQAETVLMRLLRGAGAAGLAAMAESGPGRFIRPMLGVSRSEIHSFIDAGQIAFVEDSSNSSRTILRNRIRNELLPMLECDYAPGIADRLAQLGGEMRELDSLVSTLATRELDAMMAASDTLDVSRFSRLNPALQLGAARAFIARTTGSLRRVSRAHIEGIRRLAIAEGPSAAIDLPGGWRARREYELLKLERGGGRSIPATDVPIRLSLEGDTRLDDAGFIFSSLIGSDDAAAMPASLFEAVFDAAEVTTHGLVARRFRPGDRIAPLGIQGHRKVKDVFIDYKLPRERRVTWPLLTLGEQIVWIPGMVRARAALVAPSTEIVVRVNAKVHPNY